MIGKEQQKQLDLIDMTKRSMSKSVLREQRKMYEDSLFLFTKYVVGFRDLLPTLQYPDHSLHWDLCDFIQNPENKNKLLLIPRGCFKSSIGSIAYPLWRLVKNPNTRILIASSRSELSEKFVKAIENVITGSSTFSLFWPEFVATDEWRKRHVWSSGSFLFPGRTKLMKENSVEACGVSAARAGIHVDLVICDDLVTEEAAKSDMVMNNAIEWFQLHDALFDSPGAGETLVIGTRWSHRDLYSYILRHDNSFKLFHRGCYDDDGNVINPIKHTKKDLIALRKRMTSYLFSCQYLNDPSDPERQDFREDWFKRYTFDENGKIETSRGLKIDPKNLDILLGVDPAVSEKKSACDTGIVVAGRYHTGDIFILEAEGKRESPSVIIDRIFELMRQWEPRLCMVEAVSYQRTLLSWIEEQQRKRAYFFPIRAVHPSGGKEERIRKLEPYARQGFIHLRADMDKMLDQFCAFPLGKYVDLIDTLAYFPNNFIPIESMDGYEEDETSSFGDGWWFGQDMGRSAITGY